MAQQIILTDYCEREVYNYLYAHRGCGTIEFEDLQYAMGYSRTYLKRALTAFEQRGYVKIRQEREGNKKAQIFIIISRNLVKYDTIK